MKYWTDENDIKLDLVQKSDPKQIPIIDVIAGGNSFTNLSLSHNEIWLAVK
jgi:hypothetical protein